MLEKEHIAEKGDVLICSSTGPKEVLVSHIVTVMLDRMYPYGKVVDDNYTWYVMPGFDFKVLI